MTKYDVGGMSCAACSARVEKAVGAVEGVTECSVNLLTNSMAVEGTASAEAIISAVTAVGYSASLSGEKAKTEADELRDTQTPALLKRLAASLLFLIVLMYISMGHTMWGWPLPAALAENCMALGLLELLLTVIIMVINQKFFISGFKGLIHGAPNMDTLVALGSGASFAYSVYALFAMSAEYVSGNAGNAAAYMHEFYFESAAMILTLITVGKTLEARAKGKTTNALKSLMKLAPKTAVVIRNGQETEIPVENLKTGDIFVVRPGASVPVDGEILEGTAAVDESALTGESIPVDKAPGDIVSAAAINRSGYIRCRALRVGEDTTLSQIIKMVSDAASHKAPVAKVADKVSGVFVPVVMIIAVTAAAIWLICGESFGYALARGVSVLVISCPCALGLATPVAIMVGSGVGARNGILFKSAVSLEQTGKARIVALDKTGTVTLGKPKVTDVIPSDSHSEAELLKYAFSLELKSEHPLAGAVTEKGREEGINPLETDNFTVLTGSGLSAVCKDGELAGGSLKFISEKTRVTEDTVKKAEALAAEGKTPLFFSLGGELLGIIAVADVIKKDSPEAVKELKKMGLRVVMLTGDNKRTARAIAKQVGIDEVEAEVLPDGKQSVIEKLSGQGRVIMVGDGINDAPALTRADTGIAIGAGTDVAMDAADVVLMNSRLSDVVSAVKLSRATLRNIHENLFWAFIYNIVGIPLAAGAFIPVFGLTLNPMFGAAAMSLSSFCVVANALRLNFVKLKKTRENMEKINIKNTDNKEKKTMEKTVKIEGMMCPHCEASVKKAFEALPQVDSARASHTEKTAVLTLNAPLSDDEIRKTVEDCGYKVIE